MNARASLVAVAYLVVLAACASAGLAPASTFPDKLAYAYGLDSAILQATTRSVMKGNLSSSDAQKVLADSDNAKSMLDAAASLASSGNATGANDKLAVALAALTAIQSYMTTHQGAH